MKEEVYTKNAKYLDITGLTKDEAHALIEKVYQPTWAEQQAKHIAKISSSREEAALTAMQLVCNRLFSEYFKSGISFTDLIEKIGLKVN